ncbi:OLC1v1037323C1 [Oldenlandia corymbosa var. corymbosa]|uniref:OLC1v1037323C1 n=1 Tax=Oldenlandia corymbosa var. corymbosa TaxID=529605 RepID=A0AAV1CXB7_OLDCO|nr:OLC1v1037323C1 [Oldenlandia corymbosa var. corymbosa]
MAPSANAPQHLIVKPPNDDQLGKRDPNHTLISSTIDRIRAMEALKNDRRFMNIMAEMQNEVIFEQLNANVFRKRSEMEEAFPDGDGEILFTVKFMEAFGRKALPNDIDVSDYGITY